MYWFISEKLNKYYVGAYIIPEIAKILIDSNDGQNLHKTLRKLKPGGCYSSMKFPIETISELESILNSQKMVIRKIQDVRHREIAHSELTIFQKSKLPLDFNKSTLSFKECLSAFNSAAKIINTIAKLQFDTTYDLQFTMFMYRKKGFHELLKDIYTAKKVREVQVP